MVRSVTTWAVGAHSSRDRPKVFRSFPGREDKIAQIREFIEQSFTHTVLFKESD
jgi:hypothetical protein